MTNRILKEVSPGVVAHTARSRVLAEHALMNDWLGMNAEEIFPVRLLLSLSITNNLSQA
jgi:hypothetical protein